jgi:hypothetical protein
VCLNASTRNSKENRKPKISNIDNKNTNNNNNNNNNNKNFCKQSFKLENNTNKNKIV